METYKEQANKARLKVLELIYKAQSSHIGSNFSVIDILTVLFNKVDLKKDKIILSAGWKACAFYYFLAEKKIITKKALNSYCQEGSKYIGLTEPAVEGVHFAGGSMGMGLPASVGFALSKKMKGEMGRVYCIVSDGELAIGTTWEALLIAKQHKLDNLTVIIDNNALQAMGYTRSILGMSGVMPGEYRFADGHKFAEIEIALKSEVENSPVILDFRTVKGRGVSFMQGDNLYHYKNLSEDEYLRAKQELENNG